jgi:SpoVK/Ycf46/Vps4 family AAA+-type ATPase
MLVKEKNTDNEGKFLLKRKTSFSEIKDGFCAELPESDLCFQDGENIYQFKFEKNDKDKKYEIKPGTFLLTETSSGLVLKELEFKKRDLLESVANTSKIMKEATTFFNRLHVYEKLNRPKKRGVLLYSSPGMGKTSAIEKVCLDLIKEDPGTVVIVWPTSDIDADQIVKLLSANSRYNIECTRMVLIIEDIGGGERDSSYGSKNSIDSGLLNLLDGVGVVFKLPTFIIATTNHPENLLSSLADRPGRFDLMMKLLPPSVEERLVLMEFISKRKLTDEEIAALKKKGAENFSIAHLEEIAVRAELHDKTYTQVVDEILWHQNLFSKDFEEKEGRMGLNSY